MIALPHLRTLLGAALCCAPMLSALASPGTHAPAAASAGSDAGGATDTGTAGAGAGVIIQSAAPPEIASCLTFKPINAPPLLASAGGPDLLTANLPAPGSSRKPPPSPALQKLKVPGPLQATGPITSSSDQLSVEPDGLIKLSGNVDVHIADRQIQADQLTYDRNTNDISVSGKVHYSDPTVRLQGDSGRYGDAGSQFTHAQFQFLTRPGRGSASDISMTPNKIVTLHGVIYTSCPPTHTDWDIRARELRLNTGTNQGVAHGARVDFQGIPIVYLPYLSFPLSDARQSGLLFPNFGTSSRDGAILGVPWYWNIAPNQDATFTPTYYSSRGLDIGAEYRFLSAENSGTFDGNYLPHDFEYNGERSYVRLLDRLELGDNTRVQTDLESVSDTEYFEDFTQGSQSTSTAFLPREVAVVHRDDIWNLRLESLGFETIDSTLPLYDRPYVELPRLSAVGAWSPQERPWLQTSFDGEVVDFSRSVCTVSGCLSALPLDFPQGFDVNGWRLDAKPQIGLDISAPGYFVRPNLAWEFTQYALRDADTPDTSPQRNLPIASLDSGLMFERLAGSGGVRTVTLEPRVMYVYIPYRNQSELPLFDTSTPDPNLIELFRPNRYVGTDRIGDANEVTLGVTSEMFNTVTGSRYLSATIGQSIYLTQPRVTLPGETLDTHASDLIGELNLAAYRNWNVLLDIASDAAVKRVEQAEAELQYRADGQQVVNIGYQYRDGQFQQVDTSAAWPLLGNWDLYARAVYSILDRASIEDFAGFQYRGSCWELRAVWQRSISTRTGERDTGVSLQLELTGLANVGSQVDTFLQQSIRGYSAATGKVATPPSTP